MAGSLGLSTLVCLMNNGTEEPPTSANLLGPFWRQGSPVMTQRRLDRPLAHRGPAALLRRHGRGHGRRPGGRRRDRRLARLTGRPVREPGPGSGRVEPARQVRHRRQRVPSPSAASGRRATDTARRADRGPAHHAQRHPFRPAHVHAMVYKPGYKTISCAAEHPRRPGADTACSGVTGRIASYGGTSPASPAPAPDVDELWYTLDYTFVVERGEAWLPTPPVSAKAEERNGRLAPAIPKTQLTTSNADSLTIPALRPVGIWGLHGIGATLLGVC